MPKQPATSNTHRAARPGGAPEPSSLSDRARTAAGGPPAPKAGELLARRIEAEVIADGWPVGKWLGAEPELLARYGVSRSVMREAIRILEHHMVARMRRGPGGGLIVTAPDASVVTSAAALFLDYEHVQARHLYNARSVIELKCVELAVERLTDQGTERLRGIADAERSYDSVELIAHSHELHLAIADLSEDPALKLFMSVLMNLTGEHAPPAERTALVAPARLAITRDDHAGIADAIIARDLNVAVRLMTDHLAWIGRSMAGETGDV